MALASVSFLASLIANLIDKVLSNINDDSIILAVKKEVQDLCSQFELYPHLT